jgi:hypothetical protein
MTTNVLDLFIAGRKVFALREPSSVDRLSLYSDTLIVSLRQGLQSGSPF